MGVFFGSWELWQQMTFVLAVAIAIVIGAGLIKLAWTSRILKKQEVLDEEKRARVLEMRKTGLGAKPDSTVPFGVRATQAGIEIEGIWISRPSTPNPNASSAALANPSTIGVSTNPLAKGKSLDPKSAAGPGALRMPSGYISPGAKLPTAGYFDAPPNLGRNKSTHQRSDSSLNSDALRMLEGKPPRQQNHPTYVPRSSAQDVNISPKSQAPHKSRSHSRHRGSESSHESYGSASTSPTRAQYLYAASAGPSRNASAVNVSGYGAGPASQSIIPNFPLSSPEREPWNLSSYGASETQLPLLSNAEIISMPEPTFGPGETRHNHKPRKANAGYEG